jgi:hypothetical protein
VLQALKYVTITPQIFARRRISRVSRRKWRIE